MPRPKKEVFSVDRFLWVATQIGISEKEIVHALFHREQGPFIRLSGLTRDEITAKFGEKGYNSYMDKKYFIEEPKEPLEL